MDPRYIRDVADLERPDVDVRNCTKPAGAGFRVPWLQIRTERVLGLLPGGGPAQS
jgi:hypothetical protein